MNEIEFAYYYNLQLGDRLVRAKGGIFSKHHGIYVGIDNYVPTVAENQAGKGVQYVSLSKFLNGKAVDRIEPFSGTEEARNEIITRINTLVGTQYDLINFNCEHFSELIQKGEAKSNQVNTAVGLGILALIGFALFSKD